MTTERVVSVEANLEWCLPDAQYLDTLGIAGGSGDIVLPSRTSRRLLALPAGSVSRLGRNYWESDRLYLGFDNDEPETIFVREPEAKAVFQSGEHPISAEQWSDLVDYSIAAATVDVHASGYDFRKNNHRFDTYLVVRGLADIVGGEPIKSDTNLEAYLERIAGLMGPYKEELSKLLGISAERIDDIVLGSYSSEYALLTGNHKLMAGISGLDPDLISVTLGSKVAWMISGVKQEPVTHGMFKAIRAIDAEIPPETISKSDVSTRNRFANVSTLYRDVLMAQMFPRSYELADAILRRSIGNDNYLWRQRLINSGQLIDALGLTAITDLYDDPNQWIEMSAKGPFSVIRSAIRGLDEPLWDRVMESLGGGQLGTSMISGDRFERGLSGFESLLKRLESPTEYDGHKSDLELCNQVVERALAQEDHVRLRVFAEEKTFDQIVGQMHDKAGRISYSAYVYDRDGKKIDNLPAVDQLWSECGEIDPSKAYHRVWKRYKDLGGEGCTVFLALKYTRELSKSKKISLQLAIQTDEIMHDNWSSRGLYHKVKDI